MHENLLLNESRYTRRLHTALLLAGVYVLLPFILLCMYNQPASDDYFSAVRDSNNGFTSVLHDVYFNWSGRYFAVLVSRINPLLFHSVVLYKWFAFIMLVLFITALFILTRQAVGKYLSGRQTLALTVVLTIIYFTAAPSTSEAFYWFSGAWIYQLANVLSMLFIALLLAIRRSSSTLFAVLACLLAVCIMGCNEISLLCICFCTLVFTVGQYNTKGKAFKQYLVILTACIVSAAVAILAPGNFERLNHQQEYSVSAVWTLAGGFSIMGVYVAQWLVQLLIASLLYIPLLGRPMAVRMAAENQFSSVSLKHSVAWFIGAFVFIQLFSVWAAGGSNIGRIENVIYLFFIGGYFYLLQVYLVKHTRQAQINIHPAWYTIAALLFFVNLFDINNNISTAWLDVVSGKAKRYDTELSERAVLAQHCTQDTCLVAPLTTIPKTIFFTDIKSTGDSNFFWMNEAYSAYFGKGYILVNAPLPPVQPNMEDLRNLGREMRENVFKK